VNKRVLTQQVAVHLAVRIRPLHGTTLILTLTLDF